MIPRQTDIRFTGIVFILAVLALLFSSQLIVEPPIPLTTDLLAMSPRVFPFLILLSMALVALIFLLSEARVGAFKAISSTENGNRVSTNFWRQIAFLIITIICALLLNRLGFITTMFLLMTSTSVLVGNRSLVQILCISILVPVSFYIVVTHVLRTALPEVDVVQRMLMSVTQLLPSF